jgi:hypothetical protein
MHIPTPVVALYAPALQGVQVAEPVAGLNVPASQAVHAVPSPPVYPTRHVHDVSNVLVSEKVLAGHTVQFVDASDEYVFASQAMHIPAPVVSLYAPAPHGVHATPSDKASYPARQVQDVRRGLLADENVLSGHIIQLAAPTDEYVFTPQGMHVPTPVVALYVPASHGVHATPSDAALYPARQVHVELLSTEKVLFGHAIQFVATANE